MRRPNFGGQIRPGCLGNKYYIGFSVFGKLYKDKNLLMLFIALFIVKIVINSGRVIIAVFSSL